MAEEKKHYKEESKKNYYSSTGEMTNEQLQTGALMRIADASEIMAKNNSQLMEDAKYWKERYLGVSKYSDKQSKSISALRGHITRLKKEINLYKPRRRSNQA